MQAFPAAALLLSEFAMIFDSHSKRGLAMEYKIARGTRSDPSEALAALEEEVKSHSRR